MGKLSSFASGVGEGYLASERYKDTKKRMERQDDIQNKILANQVRYDGSPSPDSVVPSEQDKEETMGMMEKIGSGLKKFLPSFKGYADGGMIGGQIPNSDRMDWQRQSFKK